MIRVIQVVRIKPNFRREKFRVEDRHRIAGDTVGPGGIGIGERGVMIDLGTGLRRLQRFRHGRNVSCRDHRRGRDRGLGRSRHRDVVSRRLAGNDGHRNRGGIRITVRLRDDRPIAGWNIRERIHTIAVGDRGAHAATVGANDGHGGMGNRLLGGIGHHANNRADRHCHSCRYRGYWRSTLCDCGHSHHCCRDQISLCVSSELHERFSLGNECSEIETDRLDDDPGSKLRGFGGRRLDRTLLRNGYHPNDHGPVMLKSLSPLAHPAQSWFVRATAA